jgi:hypothetical protein
MNKIGMCKETEGEDVDQRPKNGGQTQNGPGEAQSGEKALAAGENGESPFQGVPLPPAKKPPKPARGRPNSAVEVVPVVGDGQVGAKTVIVPIEEDEVEQKETEPNLKKKVNTISNGKGAEPGMKSSMKAEEKGKQKQTNMIEADSSYSWSENTVSYYTSESSSSLEASQ